MIKRYLFCLLHNKLFGNKKKTIIKNTNVTVKKGRYFLYILQRKNRKMLVLDSDCFNCKKQ